MPTPYVEIFQSLAGSAVVLPLIDSRILHLAEKSSPLEVVFSFKKKKNSAHSSTNEKGLEPGDRIQSGWRECAEASTQFAGVGPLL